jgi:hypothetical protein
MSYSIRPATPDDRARIVATLREYLPALDPDARWRWLYETNPHGRALTWIAIDDASGETAGITSFFRRKLIVDGRVREGALGGDGYVRPKFRRRGIGEAMHAASRRDMSRHDIDVMFGTPMPANVTPLTKVGARTITEVVRLVRPLHGIALKLPSPFAQIATPFLTPLAFGARLEHAADPDPRIDTVWRRAAPELRIATVRDAAFYGWRFNRSPSGKQHAFVIVDRKGQPIGACALERLDRIVRIVDLLAPKRTWSRSLAAIGAHARREGAQAVELKLTREDAGARRVLLDGYLTREGKPFNLLLPAGDPEAATYFDPRRWYFTWAEADQDFFD